MVRAHPDPPGLKGGGRVVARNRHRRARGSNNGGVAQLGEHLLCKQGVIGSIPFTSTNQESGDRNQGTETRGQW